MFLTGIVIGFVYGWKLTLVILSVSPLLAAAAAVGSIFLASFTTKELTAYARAGAVAEEILTAVRTVVTFNGQMKALANCCTLSKCFWRIVHDVYKIFLKW
nr:ATP-dependent translocase ABCB1-like [Chrysemys picta bellii]